jgi:hypothetical protein
LKFLITLKTKIFGILLISIAFISCNKQESLSKVELTAFVNDPSNGLTKTVEAEKMKLQLSYLPSELVWYNDLIKFRSTEKLDSALRVIRKRYYFSVTYLMLEDQGADPLSLVAGNRELYKEILSKLSFNFGDFVSINLKVKESIQGLGGVFVKSYGMVPGNTVTFFFEDPSIEKLEQIRLTIEDVGFEVGHHQFTFLNRNIQLIPKLKL